MRILFRCLPLLILVLSSLSVSAQNKPAQCGVTCEPDSTSTSYAPTLQTRPVSNNARGRSGPLSTIASGSASVSPLVLGSESYSYAIPLLHLPGRNRLDVDLTLFYNSQIWTVNNTQNTVTFNADRDFPSYGFRLGFGLMEGPFTGGSGAQAYLLTEPDGTKRELRLSSGTIFVSADASFMDWNTATHVLRRKNGAQWTYQQVGTTTFYRPVQIKDANGNYISIAYSTATGADKQAIATITDTLNRVVSFNYDAGNRLTAIVQDGQTKASFTWNTAYPLRYSFALGAIDTPALNTVLNVLAGCNYANGAGYVFAYGDWAIVNQIKSVSASGQVRSSVSYNYPAATTALSDHPTFTMQTVFDGVNTANWLHSASKVGGNVSAMAITDPYGTVTTTYLSTAGWQSGLVSSVLVQAPNGASLRSLSESWTQDVPTASFSTNPRVIAVATGLADSGQASRVEFDYSSNANISELREYDYGGVLFRKTQIDYLTAQSYVNAHILDKVVQRRVYDGGGSLKSRTDFAFDSTALTSVGGAASHDDVNYTSGFTVRGNTTAVTRYVNAAAASGPIVRQFTFDTLGNMRTAEVDCCTLRQWNYTPSTQYVFPETITSGPAGLQFSVNYTYDLPTGLPLTVKDENQKTTTFAYDLMNRPSSVTRADGTIVSTSYNDSSALPASTTTTPVDSSNSIVETTTRDGSGRTVQQVVKGASGTTYSVVDTSYDLAGRVSQTSNPHAPNESPVWTTNSYDPLGRILTVTLAGNTGSYQYAYSGNSVTVTDPAGRSNRTVRDAAGRVNEADEPGWGSATPGVGSVAISGSEQSECDPSEPIPALPRHCSRIYDRGRVSVTIGAFTASVNYSQFVSNTASAIASALASQFTSNSASPVTATLSGTSINFVAKQSGAATNYVFSATSTTSDPTNFSSPSFFADPSGSSLTGGTDTSTADNPSIAHPLVTTYVYDVLDDLTLITQGVQQRSFAYDSLGRVVSRSTPEAGTTSYTYSDASQVLTRTDARSAVTSYSYDGLSRTGTVSYSVPSGMQPTSSISYTYDQGGSVANASGRLTAMSDGVGSETYAYDSLGRLTQLNKTISGVLYTIKYAYNQAGGRTTLTYPSGRQVAQTFDTVGRLAQITSGGATLLSGVQYNAANETTALTYGNVVQESFAYNSRMLLASLTSWNSSGQLLNLTYNYGAAITGQIQSITDNLNSARTVSYSYDGWGRLKTAQSGQWGLSFAYDRYGNRQSESLTSGSGPFNQVTVDPNTNHLLDAGYAYDSSGNMTADGINSLAYDAQSRLVRNTQAGVISNYSYDGNGLRVIRAVGSGTTTVYVYSGTRVIAEYDNGAPASAPSREYIYSGSQLIATIQAGQAKFHLHDHLSIRVSTDAAGNKTSEQGHFPFGESWYDTGGTKWKFTSYERDAESSNDYATFRYDINRLGRFSSPDPETGTVANPQSLNRYTYALNDPVNVTDPDGRYPRDAHEFITFLMAAVTGHGDAAQIAAGAGAADNFWNATTGMFGIGYIANFDKHFGIPCTMSGSCASGGFDLGFQLHLVEDNSPGGPHQLVQGYGLGDRIASSLEHIYLNIVGKSPDTDLNRMGGFEAAFHQLGGTGDQWQAWGGVISSILKFRNENDLQIVGMQITTSDGKSTSYGVGTQGATFDHSETVNGITVNYYMLATVQWDQDPNVQAIEAQFSLPGSDPMAEGEALYLYSIGLGGGGDGGWGSLSDGPPRFGAPQRAAQPPPR
jgi:RHS repeat-associated protein